MLQQNVQISEYIPAQAMEYSLFSLFFLQQIVSVGGGMAGVENCCVHKSDLRFDNHSIKEMHFESSHVGTETT